MCIPSGVSRRGRGPHGRCERPSRTPSRYRATVGVLKQRRCGRGGAPAARHRCRSGVTADSSRVRFYPDCSGLRTDSAMAKPYPMRRRWVTDVGHHGSARVRSRPAMGFARPPGPSCSYRLLAPWSGQTRARDPAHRRPSPSRSTNGRSPGPVGSPSSIFLSLDAAPVARGRFTHRRCTPLSQPACVHLNAILLTVVFRIPVASGR